jgi:hypothetical protein
MGFGKLLLAIAKSHLGFVGGKAALCSAITSSDFMTRHGSESIAVSGIGINDVIACPNGKASFLVIWLPLEAYANQSWIM